LNVIGPFPIKETRYARENLRRISAPCPPAALFEQLALADAAQIAVPLAPPPPGPRSMNQNSLPSGMWPTVVHAVPLLTNRYSVRLA
jgi:hypothetical protein